MAISNKMSILGTKKAVMAYNGGYYLPSVSEEGILSWSPTVEGMAPIPEVNVRGPQGSDASVTAEAVQAVVPIAFGEYTTPPISLQYGVALGDSANAAIDGLSLGSGAKSAPSSIAIGQYSNAQSSYSLAVGRNTYALGLGAIALGFADRGSHNMANKSSLGITIGSQFVDKVNGVDTNNMCTTEGAGSITIGAGANTLNTKTTVDGVETTVESSNSVTIGCKAENKGADSVVIGAQTSGTGTGGIVIGAGASSNGGTSIGAAAKAKNVYDIAIGRNSNAGGIGGSITIGGGASAVYDGVAIGYASEAQGRGGVATGFSSKAPQYGSSAYGLNAKANKTFSTAIGMEAISNDPGAVVFVSWDEAQTTKTQLYFSGANTPLANTYANGEAIMGYVTTDSEGNMVASGFKRLSTLFDEGSMTQPAILNEDGEWEQPKVFKPSDVDMEVEEPSEPEEYQPLPVYPIVEPELEEI